MSDPDSPRGRYTLAQRRLAYLDFIDEHPEMYDPEFREKVALLVCLQDARGTPISTQEACKVELYKVAQRKFRKEHPKLYYEYVERLEAGRWTFKRKEHKE